MRTPLPGTEFILKFENLDFFYPATVIANIKDPNQVNAVCSLLLLCSHSHKDIPPRTSVEHIHGHGMGHPASIHAVCSGILFLMYRLEVLVVHLITG